MASQTRVQNVSWFLSLTRAARHCAICICLCTILISLRAQAESDTSPSNSSEGRLAKLQAIWSRQKEEIISARIRFRVMVAGERDVVSITKSELANLLTVNSHLSVPERFEKIAIAVIKPDLAKGRIPGGAIELYQDDKKTREDVRYDDTLFDRRIFDGVNEIGTADKMRQVSLHPPGASHVGRWRVSNLRTIPILDERAVESVTDDSGQIVIKHSGGSVTCDPSTGVATHTNGRAESVRSHLFTSEAIQSDCITYPGNIVFPTFAVSMIFRDEKLFRISMTAIQEATFNESISEETFKFPVAAKTKVFDFRSDPSRPQFRRAKEASADVVDFIAKSERPQSKHPNESSRIWFIVANTGVVVLLLLVVVLRAKRNRLNNAS